MEKAKYGFTANDIIKSDKDAKYDYKHKRIITSNKNENLYIPLSILHNKQLNAKEKIYLASYIQYNNNEYYADENMLTCCSKMVLYQIKKKLKKLKLLNNYILPEQAKELVLLNKNKGQTCQWCGIKTNAIQEHHYPIPKSKGGKEIVKICPNCHYEYHLIYKEKKND